MSTSDGHRCTHNQLLTEVTRRTYIASIPSVAALRLSSFTWNSRPVCGRTGVQFALEWLSSFSGIGRATDRHGPRLHDLRHRFAVEVLLRWYREDVDVERHLPELSTFLGHVKVADTFWYLSATPELLQFALDRLERGLPPKVWP